MAMPKGLNLGARVPKSVSVPEKGPGGPGKEKNGEARGSVQAGPKSPPMGESAAPEEVPVPVREPERKRDESWKEVLPEPPVKSPGDEPKRQDRGRRRQSRQVEQAAFSTIRNVPKPFLNFAAHEFRNGRDMNNTDLLMAYCYVHGTPEMKEQLQGFLTERQLSLVRNYTGTVTDTVVKKLDKVLLILERLERMGFTQELLSGFVAFDRAGFRNENPQVVEEMNFREDGLSDMLLIARRQTEAYRKEILYQEGRPMK